MPPKSAKIGSMAAQSGSWYLRLNHSRNVPC